LKIESCLAPSGMNSLTINKSSNAVEVWFNEAQMVVRLDDGREVAVPITWFPKLREASTKQRNNYRFIGKGEGLHWEDLDEDILVEALLK
jgi:hypothetical protein